MSESDDRFLDNKEPEDANDPEPELPADVVPVPTEWLPTTDDETEA